MLEAARATAAHYVADDPHRRHPLLGHRGARPRPAARSPRPAGRPVERLRAGGHLGRADRRPGAAAPRAAAWSAAARRRTGGCLFQAGLTIARTLLGPPYLSEDADAPGPAAPLGLPPAERLGLRPARAPGALRRVEPVGRLPPARAGPLRPAPRRRRAVLHLLRPGGGEVRPRRPRHGRHARASGSASRGPSRRTGSTSPCAGCGRRARSPPSSRSCAPPGRRPLLPGRHRGADRPRAARLRGEARASDASTSSSTTPGWRPRSRADLLEAGEDSFERLLRINLQGPYFLTQGVARWMLEQKARRRGLAGLRRQRDLGLGHRRLAEPRRVLRQQGRPRHGLASCGPFASPRPASRSTRCGRGSSAPT